MPQDVNIVVNKHTPFVARVFEQLGKVKALDTQEITKETVRDADVLIVRSETKVDRSLLEGSRVKFVGTVTIGKDHVDEVYLAEKGIAFVSAPGSNANSVGEYVAAALLELAARMEFSLTGKTIGIVGVGNVGSNVWRKAEALGMKVLLNDPPLGQQGSRFPLAGLDELMEADIISLHVPLNRTGPYATYHLFDEERIKKMKKGSILINTSRGAVAETGAVNKILSEKHLSAAVLDVWEKEPNIDTSLLRLVTLGTPHIAGYSLDGKLNALKMNYDAVCRFLSVSGNAKIDELLPAAECTVIKAERTCKTEYSALQDVIRKSYDINIDDNNLRGILSQPEEQCGKYFSGLRKEYRVRREFIHSRVLLPNRFENQNLDRNKLAGMLNLLGFSVMD